MRLRSSPNASAKLVFNPLRGYAEHADLYAAGVELTSSRE